MSFCSICPRQCNIDRQLNKGFCGESDTVRLARAALHFYEEPPISGSNGSGAIFFSGCNLKCVFCQNESIANNNTGIEVSIEKLADIMLDLQSQNAHNINLVTPSHYIYQIKKTLILAKEKGLTIPIVYNSSGYELASSIRELDGLVDIYLPDFKYMDDELAVKYSKAPNYSNYAKETIAEMFRQTGSPSFDDNGLMTKGVIVRHLLLPLAVNNAKNVISYLHDTYEDNIYISIMNQYTPMTDTPSMKSVATLYPELFRKVTKREYNRLLDFVLSLNITNAFFQEGETASDSFIPDFDYTGIL
ncbi:MAG: radical SAM protein [Lachnospiraceae bacterium]|nr:radical SAM protein [Lachnospiraceae bacterium]